MPSPLIRRPSLLPLPTRRRCLLSIASWPLAGGAVVQSPTAGTRVALVMGNAGYTDAPLLNAVNDARSIAEVLRGHGFTVHLVVDCDKAQMESAIARTRDGLQGHGGVGLLYYAGHGLQLDWRNFMVPLGARIGRAADVPAQTVDVQGVLDAFRAAGTRLNIVVLDACRNNPFGALASGRGLAPMDAPSSTFLAYATSPGNVAEDGAPGAGNGPYAHFLAQELKRPEARIEEVFKRVRFGVRRHTAGRQVPWESTSLEDDFSFARGIVETQRQDPRERDAAFEVERAEWERIRNSTDVDDFYRFLNRFPNGLLSELAQMRIERLQRAAVQVQANAAGVSAPDTTARRFEVGDVYWFRFEDLLKNTTENHRFSVTAADDERAEFNRGSFILTQTGGLVKNQFGTNDPPLVEIVPEMTVGRRWRSAFVQTSGGHLYRTFYDSKVEAIEPITLPIGSMRAFRVEHYGESLYPDGRTAVLRRTTWVDVTRGMVVRGQAEFSWPGRKPGQPAQAWFKQIRSVVAEQRRPR